MNLAVKFYSQVSNPLNFPGTWPAEVRELGASSTLPDVSWTLMTTVEYQTYLITHSAAISTWNTNNPITAPDPATLTKNILTLSKLDVGLGSVDNSSDISKPVSTATQTALDLKANSNVISGYRTILQASGSHVAGRTASTYALTYGHPAAITGVGTLYGLATIHIAAADYPTINGVAPKLRIRAQLFTNDVAPTGNFTFGLHPITRPATSGGAALNIFAIGAAVGGSNGATFTTPVADGLLNSVGADFALPADGPYVIAVVTTTTVATSSLVHLNAILQIRNA